jgi:UPF0271 protein
MMDKRIDLNADIGEGFGAYTLGFDREILQQVSSCNIACGMHAGDPMVMAQTLSMAREYGVAAGAHPGFPDLAGFGRREMALSPAEIKNYVIYQLGALQAFATVVGVRLQHVKPHGALYNMAAVDVKLALAIAEGVAAVDDTLILVGLAGSELIRAASRLGLRAANEIFADRGYNCDGTLISRGQPGAIIQDPQEAAQRIIKILHQGMLMTHLGGAIPVCADTVCLHGDTPGAVEMARVIKAALVQADISVMPMDQIVK